MTHVTAVITEDSAGKAERAAKAALSKGAALVELRLDYFADANLRGVRRLAASVGSRAIATLRSPSQGGVRPPSRDGRARLLTELCRGGFRYVDLELETDRGSLESLRREASRHRQDVIVSHHFDAPTDLAKVAEASEACADHGDVAKVVTPVADVQQALGLVAFAREQGRRGRRFITIGMGAAGTVIRVLAQDVGQEIQYAAFGHPSAPGQLALETALRLRGRTPSVLGLVGHPLGHSISPQIHEAALAASGLPGAYLPFDVEGSFLPALLDAGEHLRLRGFNVTIPHKEAVPALLDELDGDAAALGAVNTVVVRDGWTKGHNTDVHGFRMVLRSRGLHLGGRDVLVLGAGGAAKAVVHVLLREGARVHVMNRTPSRAEALAEAFGRTVEVLDLGDVMKRGPWDLLVNATPVGTKGISEGSPLPAAAVRHAKCVVDLVYNPPETPLLQAAKQAGIPGTSGLEMLLHQAAKSFELWFGVEAPFKAMEDAAREALR